MAPPILRRLPPASSRAPAHERSLLPLTAATLVLTLAVLAGGCAGSAGQVAAGSGEGVEVYRVSDQPPPEVPPDPAFAQVTPFQVRNSLQRITVRHSTWMIFARSEPKPLLTEEQAGFLRDALVRELPGLAPGSRIRFSFRDQYKGGAVEMEVYPEGRRLVYRFLILSRAERETGPGPERPDQAILEPLAGQVLEEGRFPVLKDDLFAASSAGGETPF